MKSHLLVYLATCLCLLLPMAQTSESNNNKTAGATLENDNNTLPTTPAATVLNNTLAASNDINPTKVTAIESNATLSSINATANIINMAPSIINASNNINTTTMAPIESNATLSSINATASIIKAVFSSINATLSSIGSSTTESTTTIAAVVAQERPADCSQRQKAPTQPILTSSARLRKCCPLGENLDIYRENQSDLMCDTANLKFEPTIISAVLYDNCIEDLEIVTTLPYEIGNHCNNSFQYDDELDAFFVLQDGSLLIIDKLGNESYTVERDYCIDMDKSGRMFAFTCISSVEEHLARGQTITVAVLMLISMPCLLLVSYLHMSLRLLRNLHGLALSLMSLCLASGYFVHSVVHIYGIPSGGVIGYIIQFFILSYFFWYFCICCNVLLNIWYKLPHCIQLNRTWVYVNFGVYCVFAVTGPAVLVTLTVQKGLPGMPSYFLQGLTESIRESQRYFIPPVSTILGLSFLVMIVSFFGFQRIKSHGYLRAAKDEPAANAAVRQFDQQKYEDVKKDAKCISLLGIIMIVTWLLEIVTFYSPGPEVYLLLCDMVNGLQGVFVLLIFLVVRRRRTIILRWWYDRGSHNIEGTELQSISKNVNPT